jgi:hypothetical protein
MVFTPAGCRTAVCVEEEIAVVSWAAGLAMDLEDLLGLDRRRRSERQVSDDDMALLQVAADCGHGLFGQRDAKADKLRTMAHQVGKRDPPANSPLGMFLNDVFNLRCGRPPAICAPRKTRKPGPPGRTSPNPCTR